MKIVILFKLLIKIKMLNKVYKIYIIMNKIAINVLNAFKNNIIKKITMTMI